MILEECTITEIAEALGRLDEDKVSLSHIAVECGGKAGWIHRLKHDVTGKDLWLRLVRLNNYLIRHHPEYYGGDCLDSNSKNNKSLQANDTGHCKEEGGSPSVPFGSGESRAVSSFNGYGSEKVS